MSMREELFANGVHYGHQTRSWSPKMKKYIWGEKDGVHLINIAITESKILEAQELLKRIAEEGQHILWVGTKRVARESILRCAQETGCPFFAERWIGGTLTNYHEVKKAVTNMLYNKEILEKADRQMYTKKEMNYLQKKIEKAEKSVGGIERLGQKPGALVIVGVKEERVALREAQRMGIPVVALVDTNCDPMGIKVVIPANDDRENSVSLVLGYLAQAVKEGRDAYLKANPLAEADEQEAKNARSKSARRGGQKNSGKHIEHKHEAKKESSPESVRVVEQVVEVVSEVEQEVKASSTDVKSEKAEVKASSVKAVKSKMRTAESLVEKAGEKKQPAKSTASKATAKTSKTK